MTTIPTPPRLVALMLMMTCLGGCTSLLGGGERDRPTLYAPQPTITIDPTWPQADISLLLAPPSAPPLLDSVRIVVRPHADEVQVLRGARWAQPPPELLQTLILRTLEDVGKLRAVATPLTCASLKPTTARAARRRWRSPSPPSSSSAATSRYWPHAPSPNPNARRTLPPKR